MKTFIHKQNAESPHITIIHRNCSGNIGNRCFRDVHHILGEFTKEVHLPGKIYFGNESFEDTVKIFANSRIVVGFHGAGFINTLFSPPGTVVLEYTTFLDMNATQFWRSNEAIVGTIHGELNWIRHTIDVDRLTSLEILANSSDKSHYIKHIQYINITGSELHNSIKRAKAALGRL